MTELDRRWPPHSEPIAVDTGTKAWAQPTIVVGLDGAPASLRAAAYAVGAARRQHARLLFVQVWEQPLAHIPYAPMLPADAACTDESRARLVEWITELVGDLGVRWELRQVIGHPLTELQRLCSHAGVAAIVLGAPARRKLPIGRATLSKGLITTRRCPVIVIP